jgi:hypothetical protein
MIIYTKYFYYQEFMRGRNQCHVRLTLYLSRKAAESQRKQF